MKSPGTSNRLPLLCAAMICCSPAKAAQPEPSLFERLLQQTGTGQERARREAAPEQVRPATVAPEPARAPVAQPQAAPEVVISPTVSGFDGVVFGIQLGAALPASIQYESSLSGANYSDFQRDRYCFVHVPEPPPIARRIVGGANQCPTEPLGAGIHIEVSPRTRAVIKISYIENFHGQQHANTAERVLDPDGDSEFDPSTVLRNLARRYTEGTIQPSGILPPGAKGYLCMDLQGLPIDQGCMYTITAAEVSWGTRDRPRQRYERAIIYQISRRHPAYVEAMEANEALQGF